MEIQFPYSEEAPVFYEDEEYQASRFMQNAFGLERNMNSVQGGGGAGGGGGGGGSSAAASAAGGGGATQLASGASSVKDSSTRVQQQFSFDTK